jgi:hypothetical protein
MWLAAALMSATSGTDAATSDIGRMDPSARARSQRLRFYPRTAGVLVVPLRGRVDRRRARRRDSRYRACDLQGWRRPDPGRLPAARRRTQGVSSGGAGQCDARRSDHGRVAILSRSGIRCLRLRLSRRRMQDVADFISKYFFETTNEHGWTQIEKGMGCFICVYLRSSVVPESYKSIFVTGSRRGRARRNAAESLRARHRAA